MKMKKTWFSYPLWLLYAVMTGILSAVYLSAISMQVWHLNQYITAALVALVFGAVVGVWFAGHKIAEYLDRRFAGDKHLANMWECFLVLGLSAAALLYRFRLILYATVPVEVGEFYELAAVKAGAGVPAMAHGASYIYTVLLSVVFSFTGNKVIAGVFLQMFLELAAMLVLYAGVRMLIGRVEAVCALMVLTFSRSFCNEMFRLTPEVFYLLLYAAGICVLGLCYRRWGKVTVMAAGIYIGLMAYLDPAGWTLAVCGVWICLSQKKETEKLWKRCIEPALLVGAALLMMLLLCGINAWCTGQWLSDVLSAWGGTYGGVSMKFPAGPDEIPAIGIGVCFIAALAVVGFWFQKKQKQDSWILLLLIFSVLDMLGVGSLQYEIFLTALWGVMAGLGITSMRTERMEAAELETIPAESLPLKELVIEEITLEEAPKKIQFIENPLPLPKKHVKKEMDFDHDVDENDDFDI